MFLVLLELENHHCICLISEGIVSEPVMKRIKMEGDVETCIDSESMVTETMSISMAPDVMVEEELVEEQCEGESDDLRRQLEEVQKQAEVYKCQLVQKEQEAEEYKKQLTEISEKS